MKHSRYIHAFNAAIVFLVAPISVSAESKNNDLVNRSYELIHANKPKKAVELLTKAISLDPNDATAYDDRASAYILLGKFEKAIEDENVSLEKDDHNYIGHLNRGSAFFRMDKNEKALADFKAAHELRPQASAALENMGITLAKQDKKEEATRILSQVRESYLKAGSTKDAKSIEEAAAKYDISLR